MARDGSLSTVERARSRSLIRRPRAEKNVDIEHLNPDQRTAVAESDLRRRERRWTYIYLALFGLVTVALIVLWYDRTAGARACRSWRATGEPRLESVSIKMTSPWRPGEATCEDEEAMRYLEGCLAVSQPWEYAGRRYNDIKECTVVLRFANGGEYRAAGPCEITGGGLGLSLPGEGARYLTFQGPMPDKWKNALNRLLGVGTVE